MLKSKSSLDYVRKLYNYLVSTSKSVKRVGNKQRIMGIIIIYRLIIYEIFWQKEIDECDNESFIILKKKKER